MTSGPNPIGEDSSAVIMMSKNNLFDIQVMEEDRINTDEYDSYMTKFN